MASDAAWLGAATWAFWMPMAPWYWTRLRPIREELVQDRHVGVRADLGSLAQRSLPALLQSYLEVCTHSRAHMSVDTVHSRHLVTHAFGLQNLWDAVLIHPGLKAMPQAVWRQTPQDRQP